MTTPHFDLGTYRFKAIIFDCDGTIADTADVHHRAFDSAFREHGLEMPDSWYRPRTGLSRGKLFSAFQQEHGVSFDEARMAARSEEIYQDNLEHVRENGFVADIARDQAGKVPMAVASAGQKAVVEATLRVIGLRGLFSHVVTVEEVAHGKPAPDLFLLAARKLGMAPADCLVFEDSNEGLEAAHRAGMEAVDVRPFTIGRK